MPDKKKILVGNIVGPQGPEGKIGPTGGKGEKGEAGKNGVGIPDGGSIGQIIVKSDNAEYGTEWKNASDLVIGDSTITGTKTWSSTKINYEITNAKNTLTTQINTKAPQTAVDNLKKVRNITLPTSGWSENKRSINVDGISLNDTPLIALDLSAVTDLATKQTQKQEWGKIIDAQTRDGYIDFYCSEVPSESMNLIVKGV